MVLENKYLYIIVIAAIIVTFIIILWVSFALRNKINKKEPKKNIHERMVDDEILYDKKTSDNTRKYKAPEYNEYRNYYNDHKDELYYSVDGYKFFIKDNKKIEFNKSNDIVNVENISYITDGTSKYYINKDNKKIYINPETNEEYVELDTFAGDSITKMYYNIYGNRIILLDGVEFKPAQ